MDYNDLNIIDFSKAPKDLINFIETCPSIYYTLLPYSETPGFVKSKNGGYVLLKRTNHSTYAMVFGDVNRKDLDIEGQIFWYFPKNNEMQNNDYTLYDFIINWDEKKVKKCKIKNSCKRIVNDENIKIYTYNGLDCNFYIDNKAYEIDNLLNKWKSISNSSVDIDLRKIEKQITLNNSNIIKISYRCNSVLCGIQIFEVVGKNIYWLTNVCLYGNFGKSHISFVYPIEYFNYNPIHYLGALPKQDNLFNHKMWVCNGNFIKFEKIVVLSTKQVGEEKRKTMLENLYNYVGI